GKQTVLAGDNKKILTICYPPDVIDDGNKTNVHSQGANTRKRKTPSAKNLKQSPVSGDNKQILDPCLPNNEAKEPNKNEQNVRAKKRKKSSAKKSKQTLLSGDDKLALHPSDANNKDSNNLSPCKKHKSAVSLQLKDCRKYPGHPKFYPFYDFSYLDLQHPYNNERQFNDLVRALGNLVVKVYFIGTSPDRPPVYMATTEECKGTGNIVSSVMKRKKDSMHCPLLECEVCKEHPGSQWGEITVDTAAHVVCDDHEVKRTICVLDYNDENAIVKILQGVRKNKISEVNDTCKFMCVTHDTKLVGELRKKIKSLQKIHEQLYKKYVTLTQNNLVILVSHPHGCQKHVTFGQYTRKYVSKRLRSKTYYTKYKYNLPSCPGSSGAPIY
ncbi:unnamed protein product, partial [Lymnaea stagnalis]